MEIHAQGLERTLPLKPFAVKCQLEDLMGSKEPFYFPKNNFVMASSLN